MRRSYPGAEPDTVRDALANVVCKQLNNRVFQNVHVIAKDFCKTLEELTQGPLMWHRHFLPDMCDLWNERLLDVQVAASASCSFRLMCSEVETFAKATHAARRDELIALFDEEAGLPEIAASPQAIASGGEPRAVLFCHAVAADHVERRAGVEGVMFEGRWLTACSWSRSSPVLAAFAIRVQITRRDCGLNFRDGWRITEHILPAEDQEHPLSDSCSSGRGVSQSSSSPSFSNPLYQPADAQGFLDMMQAYWEAHGERPQGVQALVDVWTPILLLHQRWQEEIGPSHGSPRRLSLEPVWQDNWDTLANASERSLQLTQEQLRSFDLQMSPTSSSSLPRLQLQSADDLHELATQSSCFTVLILSSVAIANRLIPQGLLCASADGGVRQAISELKRNCASQQVLSQQLLMALQASKADTWSEAAVDFLLEGQEGNLGKLERDTFKSRMLHRHKSLLVLASDSRVYGGGVHVHVPGQSHSRSTALLAAYTLLNKTEKESTVYLAWNLVEASSSGIRLYYPVTQVDIGPSLAALIMNREDDHNA